MAGRPAAPGGRRSHRRLHPGVARRHRPRGSPARVVLRVASPSRWRDCTGPGGPAPACDHPAGELLRAPVARNDRGTGDRSTAALLGDRGGAPGAAGAGRGPVATDRPLPVGQWLRPALVRSSFPHRSGGGTVTIQQLQQERFLPGPRIYNLVRIEGTLTTKTPLHIGSGEQASTGETDAEGRPRNNLKPVLLEVPTAGATSRRSDHGGWPPDGCRPFIPGSSLKGVLRSWCEQLLAPWGDDAACVGGDQRLSTRDLEEHLRDRRSQATEEQRSAPGFDDRVRADLLRQQVDLVSGVFGTGRWRGKVEVGPGRVQGRARARDLLARLPRVAIDPVLGAAEDGKLFFVEVVRPGTEFSIQLRLRNVRRWEVGLLALALESLNDPDFPTRIGAHTQQGLGQVTWSVKTCTVVGNFDGGGDGADIVKAYAAAALGRAGTSRAWNDLCQEAIGDLRARLDAISIEEG
ncbi:MAG: hypothetical protein D6798_05865 [Deltaproteobacteria bacterium]|nr:MAG: hypothetical protein D6798_05865 [Deltaproteobacteria bacterium]